MERTKGSSGRGGKSKTPQFPADLFALGTKSNQNADNKRPGNHAKPTSHTCKYFQIRNWIGYSKQLIRYLTYFNKYFVIILKFFLL